MSKICQLSIVIIMIVTMFGLAYSSNTRADNVVCNIARANKGAYIYRDVQNLQAINTNVIYQFKYNSKRYIVSVNNCIIEFDK